MKSKHSLHLPIIAIALTVILIALSLPNAKPKVTEPELNCFKVVTSSGSSFETPSLTLKERVVRKGYTIGECDE